LPNNTNWRHTHHHHQSKHSNYPRSQAPNPLLTYQGESAVGSQGSLCSLIEITGGVAVSCS